jgi:dihydropteroate synthase
LIKIGNVLVGRNSPVRVMGIINVSPESFYKGSIKTTTKSIAQYAATMEQAGAQLIDIGAMSTAPYLENNISVQEEIKRMKRAVKIVRNNCNVPISADTPRSAVAKEAVDLGVDCLNDVTGLKYDSNMAGIVAESNLPVIIGAYGRIGRIHPQSKLISTGKMSSTIRLLNESLAIAKKIGIKKGKIIIDPSVGFFRAKGKNPFFTIIRDMPWYIRDIEIISRLRELATDFTNPICISVSRKSFIGKLLDLKTEKRLIPSLVFEIISALNGAKIIRTHNVKETVHALTICGLMH